MLPKNHSGLTVQDYDKPDFHSTTIAYAGPRAGRVTVPDADLEAFYISLGWHRRPYYVSFADHWRSTSFNGRCEFLRLYLAASDRELPQEQKASIKVESEIKGSELTIYLRAE